MESLTLEDLKLRIFVDTNVLIDCFVTPEDETKDFIKKASENKLIELVTSDYALWEQNEFIRKQTWIKDIVNKSRSYKEAIKNRIVLEEALKDEVKKIIEKVMQEREDCTIFNYNLMDEATPNRDFFEKLLMLTIHSTISNQDSLILLSAYCTHSKAILTQDGAFTSEWKGITTTFLKVNEEYIQNQTGQSHPKQYS